MVRTNRLRLLQLFGSLAAILVLVSGVTFAALRSQNDQLNGNRLSSASANLLMSHQNSGDFYSSMNGYDFFDLLPGGDPGPKTGNDLYLKNAGTTNLDIQAALNPGRLYNPSQVNVGKVRLLFIDDTGTVLANPSLGELWDGFSQNKPVSIKFNIVASAVKHLSLKMQLEDGAVANSSSQVSLENIDLVLSGSSS